MTASPADPAPAPQRPRRAFRNLLAVLGGLAVGWAVLEPLGWLYTKLQTRRHEALLASNSAIRILCLGDSITLSLPHVESYPRQMEKFLNQRERGAASFAVINGGLLAGRPQEIADNLGENIDRHRPQIVVVMTGADWAAVPKAVISPEAGERWLATSRIIERSGERRRELVKRVPSDLAYTSDQEVLGLIERLGRDFHQGDRAEAEKSVLEGMRKFPQDARLPLAWAALLAARDPAKAEKLARKAENLPHTADVHAHWAQYYAALGRWDQCVRARENALILTPADPWKIKWLADARHAAGDTERAVALLKEGLQLHPKSGILAGALATLLTRQKLFEQAERYYAQADDIRLNYFSPANRQAFRRMARIAQRRKVKLVLAQYPVRAVDSLIETVGADVGAVFVDNEADFKSEMRRSGYDALFLDAQNGDMGHCTARGNRLLAENVAEAVERAIVRRTQSMEEAGSEGDELEEQYLAPLGGS